MQEINNRSQSGQNENNSDTFDIRKRPVSPTEYKRRSNVAHPEDTDRIRESAPADAGVQKILRFTYVSKNSEISLNDS